MKKVMMFAASLMLAAVSQGAAVAWSLGGNNTAYAGDAYAFFVIGQNGTTAINTITSILNDGGDYSSYAFGSGTIAANGNVSMTAANSGKTLDAGSYTAFFVVFDTETVTPGTSKYVVVDGASTLTKNVTANAATVAFAAGNASSILNDSSNWKSFGTTTPTPGPGPIPEPTSGLLLLVGGAMLALRRKQK